MPHVFELLLPEACAKIQESERMNIE